MAELSVPEIKTDRLAWVDVLRVVACFLVVFAHCCDPFVANMEKSTGDFEIGGFFGSLTRACVPLFAMMSGLLLLPVKTDMRTFYAKRLKRILIPLVVWSIALPTLYFLYFKAGVQTVNPNIAPENYVAPATLGKIALSIFNFNYDTTPLWYLYMLVGVYLAMPVISPWLARAERRDLKLFLGIWLFSLLLPAIEMFAPLLGYAGNYGNAGVWGVCSWNPFGALYYFSGFLGYVIFAYYLTKFPRRWNLPATLGIGGLLFAGGAALTYFGFLKTCAAFPTDFNKLELFRVR